MAIGIPIQRKAEAQPGLAVSPYVVSPSSTIATGKVAILIFTSGADKRLSAVTDSAGNTWTVDHVVSDGTRTISFASCQVGSVITIGTNISMTTTVTTNSPSQLWIFECSGLATSSVWDNFSSNAASGTSVTSGALPTLVQPDELLFGVCRVNVSSAWTHGTGWSDVTVPTQGSTTAVEYRIVSSTTGVAATGTWGTSGTWVALVMGYKGASSSTSATVTVPGAAAASGGGTTSPAKVDVDLTYTIR